MKNESITFKKEIAQSSESVWLRDLLRNVIKKRPERLAFGADFSGHNATVLFEVYAAIRQLGF